MGTVLHNETRAAADSADFAAEFRALISTAGVYDLASRAKLSLTGSDRVRWLNGMITNNIRDLAKGHGVYAFLLNPQGRILGDLYAYNPGDSLLLDTDRSQLEKVSGTFEHYIIMDDVEVADVSDQLRAVGIAGPQAREVLRAAGFDPPQLAPLQCVSLTWAEVPVTLVRGDHPAVDFFELWAAPQSADVLRAGLTKAGATPVSATAVELLRIAAGIPRYGQDIRERDLPQETRQERALSFTKGCYIGQEIVERIRSRGAVHRNFTGLLVDGALPPPGTKIHTGDKDVGEITSAALLPFADGETPVALGYIRKEAAIPGQSLTAGGAVLTVSSTPFAAVSKD
jgi:folate-binding protein YgfZ